MFVLMFGLTFEIIDRVQDIISILFAAIIIYLLWDIRKRLKK